MSEGHFNIFDAIFEQIEREVFNLSRNGGGVGGLHGEDKDIFDVISDNIKKNDPANFDDTFDKGTNNNNGFTIILGPGSGNNGFGDRASKSNGGTKSLRDEILEGSPLNKKINDNNDNSNDNYKSVAFTGGVKDHNKFEPYIDGSGTDGKSKSSSSYSVDRTWSKTFSFPSFGFGGIFDESNTHSPNTKENDDAYFSDSDKRDLKEIEKLGSSIFNKFARIFMNQIDQALSNGVDMPIPKDEANRHSGYDLMNENENQSKLFTSSTSTSVQSRTSYVNGVMQKETHEKTCDRQGNCMFKTSTIVDDMLTIVTKFKDKNGIITDRQEKTYALDSSGNPIPIGNGGDIDNDLLIK